MDFSVLENFKINVDKNWGSPSSEQEEYSYIPLTYFNRFSKTLIKCCDLSIVPPRKQDLQFTVVEGNTKVTNKDFISKNIKMGERRKNTQASTRTFTKKQKRNIRTWHNQYKTKFKQITAKNDWIIVKAINKRDLSEHVPIVKNVKVEELKRVGHLRKLNEKVERISWNPVGFKENQEYKINPARTLQQVYLKRKAIQLMGEQGKARKSIICGIQFLLAIMTVRGGQYPWNILIEKEGSVIIFEKYQSGGDQQDELSYLDLFTTNENTTGNMPSEESRVKDQCVNATKLTKIFRDLLASGDAVENEVEQAEEEEVGDVEEAQEQKEEDGEEEVQEEDEQQAQRLKEEAQADHVKKYVRIQVDDVDFYTSVSIDGAKVKEGVTQQCLIRSFMETGTDGGWIEDIKKAQGTLVFQEYLANSCSLQKWICEGNIAGVDLIKLGFIGYSKGKPLLINVNETTLKSLQNFISFKYSECWPIVKYIADILYKCQDGRYILSRSPYTPLALKLFKLPQEDEEKQPQEDQ